VIITPSPATLKRHFQHRLGGHFLDACPIAFDPNRYYYLLSQPIIRLKHTDTMKFIAAATSLLVAASTANALATPWLDSITGNSQTALADEPLPVKGDNPLLYCAAPAEYILDIDYVDLSPNPPSA